MNFLKKILSKRKLLIITGIVLITAIAGFVILDGKTMNVSGQATEQRTATVTKGELNVTLSGSGTVSPVNRKEIMVVVDGVVTESYLKEGKSFKEGDVLVKFNDTDARLNVKKLENTLKQKELAMSDRMVSNDSLIVTSPINGRVTEINVKDGTKVNKGDTLMTLVDESVLQSLMTFENTLASQFNGVQSVQVQIPEFMAQLTGKIQSLSQNGNHVDSVITIENPGALTSGMTVWAEAQTAGGSITSAQGILEYINHETIKADAPGTVKNLSVYTDSNVNQGKALLHITDKALPYSIESEQLSLEQAQVELKLAQEKLDNYTIKTPFDGVAVSVSNLDPGDNVEASSKIAILMDTSAMTFELSIDELDISDVKIGQKVNVTVEALENRRVEGKVTSIAPEGKTSNGVTSYGVTVTIPGIEELKSGMNVDAVIQVFNKKDALLVPAEAVQKMNDTYVVWVKGAAEEQSAAQNKANASGKNPKTAIKRENVMNSYYKGANPVRVKVGMHNETYVEITEGLKEGDVVILPPLASESNSKTNNNASDRRNMTVMPAMPGGGTFIQRVPGGDIRRGGN